MIERIFVFFFGVCFGSFLNVCIYRLPKDKSVILPRSFCPHCNQSLKWYDNIPVISFMALRGKCRFCKEKISFRYPLVELITAVLILVLYIQFGISLLFVKLAFLFCILIVVSFIDIDYHAIPAYLCVLGIITGLIMSLAESVSMFKDGITPLGKLPVMGAWYGLIAGLGFTYLFKLFGDFFINIYLTLRKKDSIEGERESLGLGDVDFMGMIGAFLGIKVAILVFFIAPFIAIVYSIFAIIFKKSHLIPYLPYLSLATLVVFFWGDVILRIIF
ncbi:MAG: prepilin peptidase [Candidatus Omnitrophota bacterium]